MGLKAIAVYRDGCKRTQPLNTAASKSDTRTAEGASARSSTSARPRPPRAVRRKLPDERASFTHKFSIGGHEGYITVGLYEDGKPGEIFVRMAKEGSTISGLMDSFATAISLDAPARRPARRPGRQVHPHRASSPRASPRTPRSRSPSRSWTTSSGGSARSS